MFMIFKQTVNSIGNVVNEVFLGVVNATRDEVITKVANSFHRLACSDDLKLRLLGSDYSTQYVFESVITHTLADVHKYVDNTIKSNVAEANAYIGELNAAVELSNRRNSRKRNANVVKQVNVKDYLIGDNNRPAVLVSNNKIIVK